MIFQNKIEISGIITKSNSEYVTSNLYYRVSINAPLNVYQGVYSGFSSFDHFTILINIKSTFSSNINDLFTI